MHDVKLLEENELPSTRQLLKSTLGAIIIASVILVVAVLPAEYGIDPTGLGATLGLTQMGEIKNQLNKEAQSETAPPEIINSKPPEQTIIADIQTLTTETVTTEPAPAPVVNRDSTEVTLAPGEAAEIKLVMNKGDTVNYNWIVNTGHVNYDTHGDKPGVNYHNYTKGKAVKSDTGALIAAFDGKHGWFWRNRSDKTVTVTLTVTGQFDAFVRVL